MKRLLCTLALAASAAVLRAQSTPQYLPASGVQVAGAGPNNTIQKAVTAAQAGGGSVQVPQKTAPGEEYSPASELTQSPIASSTYQNTLPTHIQDLRALNQDVSLAQILNLPALDDMAEGGDTFRAAQCAQAGACKVALVGNSIHENTSGIAPNDGYFQPLVAMLQRKFPNVTFTVANYSIGGAGIENFNGSFLCGGSFNRVTWGNWYAGQYFIAGPPYLQWPLVSGGATNGGCTSGDPWNTQVQTFNPDIIIFGMVENEYSTGVNQFIADMQTAITATHSGWGAMPPTIILTTDEPPNPNWTSESGVADPAIFEGLNEGIRNLSVQDSLMLVDADRYYNAAVYGIDVARRHYQAEHMWGTFGGPAYPSGWTQGFGFTGTMPVNALPGNLQSSLTWATGNVQMVQRTRSALDFTIAVTFQNLTTSDTPSVWYRIGTAGDSYRLQLGQSTSGSNTRYAVTLYYVDTNGTPTSLHTDSSCLLPTASGISLTINVQGAVHQVWCNTAGSSNYTETINLVDYHKLNAGQIGFGVQSFAGGETASNEYIYFGNPTQYFTPQVSLPSMLGVQAPPGFGGSYQANGDMDTNNASFGGDGLHHPGYVGMDTYYLAAFRPVVDHLAAAMAVQGAYSVTHQGFTGTPWGGIQDSQDGHVDFVNGPNGGRLVNNAKGTVLETWGNTISATHVFNEPISAPNLTTLGGALASGNVSLSAGAGSGATLNSISGFDGSFQISITTGTVGGGSSGIFSVTFTATRGHTAYCTVAPGNENASALSGTSSPWVFSFAATSMSLASGSTAIASSTTYIWNVNCP